MKRRRYPAITGRTTRANACAYPPLGNDLRTVLHYQNHMLLLCTPSAVLLAKQADHVSGRKMEDEANRTSVEAVQPSGKIQLLGLLP